MPQLGASLNNEPRFIIYNCNMFNIDAIGYKNKRHFLQFCTNFIFFIEHRVFVSCKKTSAGQRKNKQKH